MDPLLIVSPHYDDGVISCGQLMAGRPDCVVATVFSGTPERAKMLTTYDANCGFGSASTAMARRTAEDVAALRGLGARQLPLGFVDDQYRAGAPVDVAAITIALVGLVDYIPGVEVVLGPLGLAHPDHHVVADAVAGLLVERPALQGWLYEDLPSRVRWPQEVPARLDRWRDRGYDPQLGFLGTGDMARKVEAIQCYRSQLGQLGNMHEVLVGERHWRLWRTT